MTSEPLYKVSVDTNVEKEIKTAKKLYEIFYLHDFMSEKGKKLSRRKRALYQYLGLVIVSLFLIFLIRKKLNTGAIIERIFEYALIFIIITSFVYFITYFLYKYSAKRMYKNALLELEKPFGLISNTKEIYVWEREIMIPNIRDDVREDDDFIPVFPFDDIEKIIVFNNGFIMINRYKKRKKKVLFLSNDILFYTEIYELVTKNLSKRKIIEIDINEEFWK